MAGRNFVQATPFFDVSSIEASKAFYRDVLGFAVWVDDPTYLYLGREKAGIRLLAHSPEDGPLSPGTAYVDLLDLEAYWKERREALARLAPEDVHGPFDKPYGQRELIVRDPDGHRIFFGQGIGANANQWDDY